MITPKESRTARNKTLLERRHMIERTVITICCLTLIVAGLVAGAAVVYFWPRA